MGVVDTKDAMSAYMMRKIQQDEKDGDRQDKKMKLEEDKFAHAQVLDQQTAAEATASVARQATIDDRRLQLEEKRADNDHKLAMVKEENRADEVREAQKMQVQSSEATATQMAMIMKSQEEAAKASAANTAMMMKFMESMLHRP